MSAAEKGEYLPLYTRTVPQGGRLFVMRSVDGITYDVFLEETLVATFDNYWRALAEVRGGSVTETTPS